MWITLGFKSFAGEIKQLGNQPEESLCGLGDQGADGLAVGGQTFVMHRKGPCSAGCGSEGGAGSLAFCCSGLGLQVIPKSDLLSCRGRGEWRKGRVEETLSGPDIWRQE